MGYAKLLDSIKARVRAARLRAVTSVNSELILLYWHIGREISKRQSAQGWGAKIVDRLSLDLKKEFPDVRGFSPRNLRYMKEFSAKWPVESIVQTVSAQLSWSHNTALLGMILCRSKNKVVVEYSLLATGKPIGVASYTLSTELPQNLKGALPAPKELERLLRSRNGPESDA